MLTDLTGNPASEGGAVKWGVAPLEERGAVKGERGAAWCQRAGQVIVGPLPLSA